MRSERSEQWWELIVAEEPGVAETHIRDTRSRRVKLAWERRGAPYFAREMWSIGGVFDRSKVYACGSIGIES